MNFVKNLKLFHKFLLLTAVTTVGFSVVGYAFHLLQIEQVETSAARAEALNLSSLVVEIESGGSQVQGHQADFVLTKSMETVDAFNVTMAGMLANVDELVAVSQSDKEQQLAIDLRSTLTKYDANFHSLVTNWQILGLDHESGLHGKLRKSVHDVEASLNDQQQIYMSHSMLMMRRHEKDYMARRLSKYVDKMAGEQQRFSSLLSESDLPPAAKSAIANQMQDYYRSFLEIPSLDAKIAEAETALQDILVAVDSALTALAVERADQLQQNAVLTEATNARIIRNFYLVLGLIMAAMFVLLMLMARSIVNSVRAAGTVTESIAAGHLDNDIEIKSADETGQLLSALKAMQSNLRERIEADRQLSAVNGRIKQALDNVNGNVLVADVDHSIVYMNHAASRLFHNSQAEIGKNVPDFDAGQVIGSSITRFYENPSEQGEIFADLEGEHHDEIRLGGLTLKFVANPVIGVDGRLLGTVVELTDRTLQLATEEEVQHVVERAMAGDLSERISLDGKAGFFGRLSEGVNQLVEVAEQVINDTLRVFSAMAAGDLTQTIDNDYQGSFEQLMRDANASVAKLTEVVGQIQGSASSVKIGADEISQGNSHLSQRTEEQASNLEETASSMEEMTSTVKRNADNAAQANQLAQAASEQAQKGGAVVGEAVKAMSEINESSKKISDIIGVINEIAFQTNLLALNASVEAARAGDQGRGFAVVASEVRNLAGRSATAAKEIKDLIQDSSAKVDEGSRLVNESGETLLDIVERVTEVTSIVGEIAGASQEQSAGIDEVNKAIAQMDELTQQNAALVEEAAAASESMGEQAGDLSEMVTFFTVGDESSGKTGTKYVPERRSAERPWTDVDVQPAPAADVSVPVAAAVNDVDESEWEEF